MSDNDAMKKLLYAILKQKCLKDVDWNKVAADPVLTTNGQPDVTNGHAARMRYSRFKKQMEGGATGPSTRKPRATPISPKKPRERGAVGKKDVLAKRVKIEAGRRSPGSGSGVGVKSENIGMAGAAGMHAEGINIGCATGSERRQSVLSYTHSHQVNHAADEIRIKHEPGHRSHHINTTTTNFIRANSVLMMPTPNPSTPRYSPSPSPSEGANHSFQTSGSGMAGMGEMGMLGSFNMAAFEGQAHGHETADYLRAEHGDSFDTSGFEDHEGHGYENDGGAGAGDYTSLLGAGGFSLGMEVEMEMGERFGLWNSPPPLTSTSSGMDGGIHDGVDSSHVGREGMFKEEDGGNRHGAVGNGVSVKTEERWEDAYRRV